ncbi:unnamed protein product [Linum tenue]|uniref:AAA+ ATPase domain-containing protein n=1 Tax=Linum tenue TaxID=586396 RepID=A0AAV0NBH4_9ROSI|nr:unnamed protein product [Linum tenue]
MFIYAMFQQYFPYELRGHAHKYTQKLVTYFYPYIQITFHELTGEKLKRSDAYFAIQNYLADHTTATAKRLKADVVKGSKSLVLTMDDHEQVMEEFQGIKIWWSSNKNTPKRPSFSFYPKTEERRYYTLTFHKRYRDAITKSYIDKVLKDGKAIAVRNRERKLYTNNPTSWSHIVFKHPASFDTLAIDPARKREIMDDLLAFSKSEEYYARIGKAWKRGYLLYGPPGTGKTTMIAAIANFLSYDIYDLELTAVKDNSDLRKLLIEISSKAVVVIEDIDCSLEITGQRKKKKEKEGEDGNGDEEVESEDETESSSKVTLSGLLNIIDGIWSASGGERVIIFTTNHVEKLDEALIRKGRMDKHIELSYCDFEGFKVLAKNYLSIETHPLFEVVRGLLEKTKVSPADVAESLMQKAVEEDADICLNRLIRDLESKSAKEGEQSKEA